MTPGLTEPITLAGRTAPARVMFGPHPTNLGDERALSDRHVAYYARRARGGTGILVTETASVHHLDRRYERAPLAEKCERGWAAVVDACRPYGALVLAGLGHSGLEGDSGWTRAALWGPSRVPDPATRELPMEMTAVEIRELTAGFATAAALAVDAGVDGIEIDVGPRSLLRQFLSGLTNQRTDEYGHYPDRLLLEVVDAVRARLGSGRILAVRLACDENAPWAGITPHSAARYAQALAARIDLLTVVRGGLFSPETYRPDAHTEPGFNAELCQGIREALGGSVPVTLQGSIVDPRRAQDELDSGTCDLVEMTRAQIADPDLVTEVRRGRRPRPCVLCNQACLVDDYRNPAVGCIGNAETGRELRATVNSTGSARDVLVVGAGPAGLEAARLLATRGHSVVVAERGDEIGGAARIASSGAGRPQFTDLTNWLDERCRELGVEVRTGVEVGETDIESALAEGKAVVLATGGRARPPAFRVTAAHRYTTASAVLDDTEISPRRAVVWDPEGGPVAVAVAERLAGKRTEVHYATPDATAGSRLAPTGDLVAANARLQRSGVARYPGTEVRAVGRDGVTLVDRFSGALTVVSDAVLVDCAPLLPAPSEHRSGAVDIGDRVAPRTVRSAVLDAYEVAREL